MTESHNIVLTGPVASGADLPARNPEKIKTAPSKIIEYAFALVIAAMILSMGAAFCIKFLEEAKTTDEYLSPPELEHEHWTHTAKVLASFIPANPQQRQPWMTEVLKVWNADS